jgi:hypothetical protein
MTDALLMTISATALDKALPLLTPAMDTPAARVQLLTMGLQESGLTKRVQMLNGGARGAARGLWQNEQGGGVRGVLMHPASHVLALKVCQARGVAANPGDVWARMEFDDVLACAFARLLLFTDPQSIPAVDDADGGWAMYVRCWRPGKPKPDTWPVYHARAKAFVVGAP